MTLSALFTDSARRNAERDFLHVPATATHGYADGAITVTYGEAARRIEELQRTYQDRGYGAGGRVAIALDNRPEFFLHLIALNALRLSVVPLNVAMSAAELNYVLTHSDAELIVTHEGHFEHLRQAAPEHCPVSLAGTAPPLFASGRTLVRNKTAGRNEAALLYTSGTTGTPKGCVLEESYFEIAGRHYLGIGGYCAFREGSDRLITPLPVSHMNALVVSFMAMVMTGGCLVQLDRFHPSSWWRSVRDSRATCFHYLGVMPAMLLGAAAGKDDDFGDQLRFGFGAGVDPRHHAPFEARFGVPLIEAWAMTETGGGAWITASHEPRHVGTRCFGRAPVGLDWRLVDEMGRDVHGGEAGELLVRRGGGDPRRGFFSGYHKDEPSTNAAWSDGWFHTGDIVRVDSNGAFFFVDRSKNIVRRSGENIAAVEVESLVAQQPGVAACAVTAVPDELRGEEVFLYVVTQPGVIGDRALAERIQDACLRTLAYFKAPGHVEFIDHLPQTASQKLARGTIKKLAAASVAGARSHDLRNGKRRPAAVAAASNSELSGAP